MSTILKHTAAVVRAVYPHVVRLRTNSRFPWKARLSARSRARAYATTSSVRKGKHNLRTVCMPVHP